MSRQEDFIQAGIDYRMEHGKPMCIAGSNLADVERDLNRVMPFEAGAEYGYKFAKKMIENYLLCVELSNFFPTLSDEEADKGKEKLIESISEFLDEL